MNKNAFAEQLHSKFRVELREGGEVELELDRIEAGNSTAGQENFSLLFYGPKDVHLGQGTFKLEHEKMGELQIFLVPIGVDQRGVSYLAVFSVIK